MVLPPLVTGRAGQLVAPVGGHELGAAVTVNAGQAALLMDVRDQVMILNPVGPGIWLAGGERSAVLRAEVLFETAVIIGADRVGVMTAQTLLVAGRPDHGMTEQFAAGKGHVTGGASGPPAGIGVIVTGRVDVAAQTAAAQHVVGQLQLGGRMQDHRDFGEVFQGIPGSEVFPDQVDRLAQGKMQ